MTANDLPERPRTQSYHGWYASLTPAQQVVADQLRQEQLDAHNLKTYGMKLPARPQGQTESQWIDALEPEQREVVLRVKDQEAEQRELNQLNSWRGNETDSVASIMDHELGVEEKMLQAQISREDRKIESGSDDDKWEAVDRRSALAQKQAAVRARRKRPTIQRSTDPLETIGTPQINSDGKGLLLQEKIVGPHGLTDVSSSSGAKVAFIEDQWYTLKRDQGLWTPIQEKTVKQSMSEIAAAHKMRMSTHLAKEFLSLVEERFNGVNLVLASQGQRSLEHTERYKYRFGINLSLVGTEENPYVHEIPCGIDHKLNLETGELSIRKLDEFFTWSLSAVPDLDSTAPSPILQQFIDQQTSAKKDPWTEEDVEVFLLILSNAVFNPGVPYTGSVFLGMPGSGKTSAWSVMYTQWVHGEAPYQISELDFGAQFGSAEWLGRRLIFVDEVSKNGLSSKFYSRINELKSGVGPNAQPVRYEVKGGGKGNMFMRGTPCLTTNEIGLGLDVEQVRALKDRLIFLKFPDSRLRNTGRSPFEVQVLYQKYAASDLGFLYNIAKQHGFVPGRIPANAFPESPAMLAGEEQATYGKESASREWDTSAVVDVINELFEMSDDDSEFVWVSDVRRYLSENGVGVRANQDQILREMQKTSKNLRTADKVKIAALPTIVRGDHRERGVRKWRVKEPNMN